MTRFLLAFIVLSCSSCFLFSGYKKSSFRFTENGSVQTVNTVVPRRYSKMETTTDSAGNQQQFIYYPGGAVLYFARVVDTGVQYQYINYDRNLPKEIYGTRYYKGVDSTIRYWRETRFGMYKAGYRGVGWGEDGSFDSSLNFFSLKGTKRR